MTDVKKVEALAMVLSASGPWVDSVAKILDLLDVMPPEVAAVAREDVIQQIDCMFSSSGGPSLPEVLHCDNPALLKAWCNGNPLRDALPGAQPKK